MHFEGKIKRLDLWKHPYETDATSCRQTVTLCEANPHLRSVAFTIAYIKAIGKPPGPPDGQSGPASSPLLVTNLSPVLKDIVGLLSDSIHVPVLGKTAFMCSSTCLEQSSARIETEQSHSSACF